MTYLDDTCVTAAKESAEMSCRPSGAGIVMSAGFGLPYASAIARRRRMASRGA
jgi:hypothetical protein